MPGRWVHALAERAPAPGQGSLCPLRKQRPHRAPRRSSSGVRSTCSCSAGSLPRAGSTWTADGHCFPYSRPRGRALSWPRVGGRSLQHPAETLRPVHHGFCDPLRPSQEAQLVAAIKNVEWGANASVRDVSGARVVLNGVGRDGRRDAIDARARGEAPRQEHDRGQAAGTTAVAPAVSQLDGLTLSFLLHYYSASCWEPWPVGRLGRRPPGSAASLIDPGRDRKAAPGVMPHPGGNSRRSRKTTPKTQRG